TGTPSGFNPKLMTQVDTDTWELVVDTSVVPDGAYLARFRAYDSLNNFAAAAISNSIVDSSLPSSPTIIKPSARQWFKSGPILNQWPATTDVNGISHYQIAYNYDDGHTFSGANTCPAVAVPGATGYVACRDVAGLTRNHSIALSEQGGVTIW